ncbi:MAG: MarR family winged helix-turn-helix transcriptional regulator [bacterium]
MVNKKTPEQLERNFKGVANHRRIEVLLLVSKVDNISLNEIAGKLKCNFKTLSEHTKKLVYAGLLNKRHTGDGSVRHSLSPYGKKFVKFIESFHDESK